jgi:hypothetical protein
MYQVKLTKTSGGYVAHVMRLATKDITMVLEFTEEELQRLLNGEEVILLENIA